jgi:hypothetical protein
LLQQGTSRQDVASGIEGSPEYWTKQVREAYENILRREPELLGFEGWIGGRQEVGGELNLLANFFGSPEYFLKAGSTSDGFVHALYRDILNRDPEPSGLIAWSHAVGTGTPFISVATQFLVSPEASRILVDHFYHQYLARAGEPDGLLAWSTAVSQGMSREEMRSQFIGSPEYFHRLDQSGQDAVLHWNQVLLDTIRRDATTPPLASRNMAIVQASVADAVNAIAGTPAYFVSVPAPAGASVEAAVASAAHRTLTALFPGQTSRLDGELATSLSVVPAGQSRDDGVALGRQVADAMLALRAGDGWDRFVDYTGGTAPGQWQPTAPMFDVALAPQWADLQPFVMDSAAQFRPSGPPALDSAEYAAAVNEIETLGQATGSTRTPEQTQIARFWSDGAGTYTPAGHWNQIAEEQARRHNNSLVQNARLFAELDFALADAAIVAWDAKYHYGFWRPITAIRGADTDNNPDTRANPGWNPLLITPPFPEYISGHSTFSGAAASILTAAFGDNVPFDTTSPGLPGVTRSFTSFQQAADEAGRSRVYGGIHYQFSNQDGLAAGRALGSFILDALDQTTDTRPPQLWVTSAVPGASAGNVTLQGRVLDARSGVASLEVQVDSEAFTPLIFDAQGNFTFTTALATDGSADGTHTVRLRATDQAGNSSPTLERSFTLDTRLPNLEITSPVDAAAIDDSSHIIGTAGGTGSAITQLSYQFDSGNIMPLPFDPATGSFDQPLNLSRLAAGSHTLTVTARDTSGLVASTVVAVNLDQAIPFQITRFTPADGALDVGSTFRPQVFFSRPIDPSSLTSDNFYATEPSGARLAAHIVPAGNGSFAWLFFSAPMPGAAMITVHLDGSTIRAADGTLLDADGDGSPGGVFSYTFSTVSLTLLSGTSLSGIVLDPGPDLRPMTFDDMRAGPDGILHTPDDLFLNRLAGVKVFIIGMEDQAVFTDVAGSFHFDNIPAGNIKLAIDGRTASNAPAGFYFPEMIMDLYPEAGRANTVMGTMGSPEEMAANRDRQEVYLPRLETSILQDVSTTEPTMVHVDAAAAPNITEEQRQMLTLQVQPGSLLDQNGNPVANGQVGISTVPPELVRDMLPAGLLQHTFDITVQAPGITNFSTPAPMTFPNLFGAVPGTQLNFLSFDHTTGRLVIEGTATVSADGLSVSTDPGTGITHPGWHGLTPPGSQTGSEPPAAACRLPERPTVSLAAAQPPLYTFTSQSRASAAAPFAPTQDFLFSASAGEGLLEFTNTCVPPDGELRVTLMFNSSNASQFLVGLPTAPFRVESAHTQRISFEPRPFSADEWRRFTGDRLYGLRVQVKIERKNERGIFMPVADAPVPFFIYRYVDAADDDANDSTLRFNDTFNDNVGGVNRERFVDYFGDSAARPILAIDSPSSEFQVAPAVVPSGSPPRFRFQFDPTHTQDGLTANLRIGTPGSDSRPVTAPTSLTLRGNGTGPVTLYADEAGFAQALTFLVNDASSVDIVLQFDRSIIDPNNPPTFFRISLPTAPGRNSTDDLRVGVSADDMRSALERLDIIGAGGIQVTFDPPKEGPTGTNTIIHTYHLVPSGTFATRATPDFAVNRSDGPGTFHSATATRNAAHGILTQNQRDLLATPQLRIAFVRDVLGTVTTYFQAEGAAVEISPDTNTAPNVFSFHWLLGTNPDDAGVVAHFNTTAFAHLQDLLHTVFANVADFNRAQVSFRLAQILAESRRDPSMHRGDGFVNHMFDPNGELPADASREQLVSYISEILAHEFAHGLGLPHTAAQWFTSRANETQRIELIGGAFGSDRFQLTFAGASTDELDRGATADQVQTALRGLPGLVASGLTVTGDPGGPYEIHFDATPGVQFPQIDGFGANIAVHSSTLADGRGELSWSNEVFIGPTRGRDDVMVNRTTIRPVSFQASISQVLLRLSLGLAWGAPEGLLATSIVFQESNVGHLTDIRQTGPLGEDVPDPDDFTYEGPGLTILTSEGELVTDPIDFGTVEADGAGGQNAAQHFTLLNFGSQDVTIRSIRVVNSPDAFHTSVFPVTILHPGETLGIDVTFDPLSTGPKTGTLVIDSNIEGFLSRFDLTGEGRRTTADLQIIGPGFNFQGLPVGTRDFTDPDAGISLRNDGVLPVTITGAHMVAGPDADEFIINFTSPVVIQPNEIGHIQMGFAPSSAGLRHGVVEILSDDPNHPILHYTVVGTGLIDGNLEMGNDFVAVEDTIDSTNNPVLRQRSDAGGNWQFFLPPNQLVHVIIFDPVSGLVSHSYERTNGSGIATEVNGRGFEASIYPDTDGDGLPDDIEFAIGTDPNRIDTDGDGISDFAAVEQGLNPLSDRPAITGVIAALDLGGEAKDIKLAADPTNPARQLGFVAAGSGLSIVGTTRFDLPVLLSQLALPSQSVSVAVDAPDRLVAVAGGTGGLHLIDISDPARPQLRRTISVDASQVEIFEGLVYVASGEDVVSFDPVTFEEVQRLPLGQRIVIWRREGSSLFALTSDFATQPATLRVVDLSGLEMVARGSLPLPKIATSLFVSDGVAWIGGFGDSFADAGLMTVDVRALDNLTLISDVDRPGQFLPAGFALNGSGLGIFTGPDPSSTIGGVAGIVNTSMPDQTGEFFTQFSIPQRGQAVALASGIAYVADGSSGLQVVNYLAFDQGSIPPTIVLNLLGGDLDPNTPGLQLLESSSVNLTAHISDDVQVRNVELLVNGLVVRNEISYPYDFSTILPRLADGSNRAVLQLRATDTGGNVQLSDPVVIDLLADTVAPGIVNLDPPEGSTQPLSFHKVTVQFSEPVDLSSINATNLELIGPNGTVTPLNIRIRQRGSSFEFVYAPLEGDYQFVIHVANIRDRVGNPLGAGDDVVRSFRVGNIVREPTIRWINAAGGFWDDPANWDAGRVPGEMDDVRIDVTGGATVTFRDPHAGSFPPQPVFVSTVRSLVSNNPFSIIGGDFVVTETMQVNNLFQIGGVAAPGPDDFPTLTATVLQGDGGQGITFAGSGKKARLDDCIILAPMTLAVDNFELRIHGGLSLLGTATITGTNAIVRFEGDQTITQGEFVLSGAFIDALGPSNVTFGSDVYWHGASASFHDGPNQADQMTLINFGRIVSDNGSIVSPMIIHPFSFTNHGIVDARNGSWLAVDSMTWTNSSDGQILADHGNLELGVSRGTSWSSAGTISVNNQSTAIIAADLLARNTLQWSNTGTILSQDSDFTIRGSYSSASLENFRRSGGFIVVDGVMDNTGRTFTLDAPKGSWAAEGTIIGGTLVLNNPIATLDVAGFDAIFDGVTLNGLLEVGVNHQGGGGYFDTSALTVRNGLTLTGTIVVDHASNSQIDFDGEQTVHGGIFAGRWGTWLGAGILTKSGEVTFDADVTFEGPINVAAATLPNIASTAIILGQVLGDAHAMGEGGD